MKRVAIQLLFCLSTSAAPSNNGRSGKILNPFNIVQFPNDDCVSASQSIGTCYTGAECSELSGRIDGPCASGFGVCCIFVNNFCGSTVNQNKSYLWSPGYPSKYIIDQKNISQYKETSQSWQKCVKCLTPTNRCVPIDRLGDGTNDCDNGSDEFFLPYCKFNIQRCSLGVCTLRLDFESFDLLAGSGTRDPDSECRDALRISYTSSENHFNDIPTICGFNTGEHIFVDIGNDGDFATPYNSIVNFGATIDVRFGLFSGSRLFSIRVTQIPCDSEMRPNNGCLQYFTGITGRITTFNFNNNDSAHLDKQDYDVCIRREKDYCCVKYSLCDDPNSFSIDNTRYQLHAKTQSQDGILPTSPIITDSTSTFATSTCTRDWIEIYSSNGVCSESGIFQNRYCGLNFGYDYSDTDQEVSSPSTLDEILSRPQRTVCDCTPPFSVGIRTSNETRGGADPSKIRGQPWDQEELSLQARGVCLNYEQILCDN